MDFFSIKSLSLKKGKNHKKHKSISISFNIITKGEDEINKHKLDMIEEYRRFLFYQNYFMKKPSRMLDSAEVIKPTKIYSFIKGLRVRANGSSIPHVKKIFRGGEDAYKIVEDNWMIVVADGVGGWNSKGVDPSLFSKCLVKNVGRTFNSKRKTIFLELNVEEKIKNLLQKAINSTISIKGSSTLSLFMINPNERKGYSALIGDSLILMASLNDKTSDFYLSFISSEQNHGFNIPYQVGLDCDSACLSKVTVHEIKDKDIVIVATDGLWDNLSVKNILSLINQVKTTDGFVDTEILSQLLVKNAQVITYNK